MSHDEDVFATLQLHDDGFKADDDVTVGLAAEVPVIVFIFIALAEILWELLLDFTVG